MVAALGVNVRLLYTFVFGFGAAPRGLAGLMSGPIHVVQPGMGELILIEVCSYSNRRHRLDPRCACGRPDRAAWPIRSAARFVRPMLATVLSTTAASNTSVLAA